MKTSPPYGVCSQKHFHLMEYANNISPRNGVFQQKYVFNTVLT